MKNKLAFCLAALLCADLLVLGPLNAAEQGDRDEELIVVTYPIRDLPVWSLGVTNTTHRSTFESTFDPSLLVAYLKSAVEPDSWDRGAVAIHKTTCSLVIRQTRQNHQRVANVLSSFRPDIPGEQPQEIDEAGTSRKWVSPIDTSYDVAEGQDRRQSITISRIGGDFIFPQREKCDRSKNNAGIGFSVEARLGHLRTSATQLSSLLGIR